MSLTTLLKIVFLAILYLWCVGASMFVSYVEGKGLTKSTDSLPTSSVVSMYFESVVFFVVKAPMFISWPYKSHQEKEAIINQIWPQK